MHGDHKIRDPQFLCSWLHDVIPGDRWLFGMVSGAVRLHIICLPGQGEFRVEYQLLTKSAFCISPPVMNPTTEPSQLQPPQPPQPHRPSTSCDRHPDEHFTGFCPSCLCERLAVLEPSSSSASSSRKPPIPTTSTATAALKAIFKPSGGTGSSKPSFFPELRRTKSFSASKNEGFSGVFEPQRKSCDVRVRSTLSSLFYQDDERNTSKRDSFKGPEIEFESRISSSSVRGPVFESKEEDEIETDTDNESGVLDEPF
ncbi:hypothetical protein GH714_016967 [Hevea brasiliensis]|uniref:Uncharacterized protein n=1 Tax=Hevea brasiliensis TaxID=3981 RepID=A0A6A6LY19_HEVBR|nr:hypothetical protein GH714_016967 [Hevea brasiliensis]